MRKAISLLAVVVALMSVSSAALASPGNGAGGVSGPAFYVDGELYRTVGTPTDLSGTGAPIHSFDTIYAVGGGQPNVATAAPGDQGYSGGRWQVHALAYNTGYAATVAAHDANGSGDLDSDEEINAALADAGAAGATDVGVVVSFECPVIPQSRGRN
jgi:hypothetical protein